MAQAALNVALPATMVRHQSKESAENTSMLSFREMAAQELARYVEALQLNENDSKDSPDGIERFHHLNFFGFPVYAKCGTSPATSLAILMSNRWGLINFDKDFGKAILVWGALTLLEPVAYFGPKDTLEKLRGTALKEAVTGHCVKVYTSEGTWLEDEWAKDEDEPFNYRGTCNSDVLFNGRRCRYKLAPEGQAFIDRLRLNTDSSRDGLERFKARRARSQGRPQSTLREVTSASDFV